MLFTIYCIRFFEIECVVCLCAILHPHIYCLFRIPCWESPSTAAASSTAASRANVFISAGDDVAVWDLNDGPFPLHCFRVDHGNSIKRI